MGRTCSRDSRLISGFVIDDGETCPCLCQLPLYTCGIRVKRAAKAVPETTLAEGGIPGLRQGPGPDSSLVSNLGAVLGARYMAPCVPARTWQLFERHGLRRLIRHSVACQWSSVASGLSSDHPTSSRLRLPPVPLCQCPAAPARRY